MPEFQRKSNKFVSDGLNLVLPVDLIPKLAPTKFPILINVRQYTRGVLESRPGLGAPLNPSAFIAAIHSIRRLNDLLPSAASAFARIVGAGADLYLATSATPLDTGYSGNPLSMISYRPPNSPEAWMYVADSVRMKKVRADGTLANVGVAPPLNPPTVGFGVPNEQVIDNFAAVGSWSPTGAAGSLSATNRVNTTIAAVGPFSGIAYDSGSTGWASVVPAALNNNLTSGTRLTVGSGGPQEIVTVRGIFPAIPTTAIAGITYDSGTSGLCTIQPGTVTVLSRPLPSPIRVGATAPVAPAGAARGTLRGQIPVPRLAQNAAQHLVTQPALASQLPALQMGSLVRINSGGGTDETVEVISVAVGLDGNVSFRCSTTYTHAVAETLAGVACFRANFANTHTTGAALVAGYVASAITSGVGNISETAAFNLAVIGTRPTQPTDEFHISISIDNLSNLVQGMVEFDVDSTTNDFAHNYYYYPFRPNDLTPAVSGALTQLTAQQTAIQNAQIYEAYTGIPPANVVPPYYVQAAGERGGVVLPGGEPFAGETLLGAVTNQTATGTSQWTELRFKVSDLIPVGSDMSRTLANVAAVRISFNCSGTINIKLSSFFLQGSYGPDVGSGPTASALGYYYCYCGRSSVTGATSNSSPATRSPLLPHNQRVVVNMTQHPDPQIDTLDVYRFGGTLYSWIYLGSTPNSSNPSFDDDYPDQNIASSNPLAFDNFQPWPIADLPRTGTCNVSGTAVSWASGDHFNIKWAPGSLILINGIAYTLYQQPSSASLLQTVENIGTLTGATFELKDPIIMGQPLPFLWGPYGQGETALFAFACGDPDNPGVLYISKGNNFDSTSDAYQIDVTSPSEPLQNGCMYGTQSFVFSTEHDFMIFPSFTGANLFETLQVAQGDTAGLYAPWGLAVGTAIYKIVKDGIVASQGGQPVPITNADLYPLFPHDGQPGVSVNGFSPPDMTQTSKLRLSYYDGLLYFDYLSTGGVERTMVYSEQTGAWSHDIYTPTAGIHYGEEGPAVHSLLVGGSDGNLYPSSGTSDNGTAIAGHVRTPSDDQGDSRAKKLYGDLLLDYDAGGTSSGVSLVPYLDDNATTLPASVLGASVSGRSQSVIDIDSGLGQLNRNLSLDLTWSATGKVYLYEWQPSYIQKVEDTYLRATDWMDAGYEGAKYVQGCVIEADTGGLTRTVEILYDGVNVGATLTVNQSGQQALPYSFAPFIGHLLKLLPTDANSWRLFSVRWIWEPVPELATTWQTQGLTHGIDGFQHLRDFYIALISTAAVTLSVTLDGGTVQTYSIPSTGGAYAKTYLVAEPNKSKLYSYGLSSSAGFRLFQNDCEVRVKGWRDGGPYRVVRPFGDQHATGAAKI